MRSTFTTAITNLGLLALCLLVMAPQAYAQRQALSLSGQGIVTATDAPELDVSGTAITLEVWIKHDGESDPDAIILNKGTTGGGYQLTFVGSGEEPAVRFRIHDLDWSGREIISNAGVPAHQWTHVAATYDGSQFNLYINGELDNTWVREDVEVGANDNPLVIGSDNGGTGRFYSGEIDDVRIWSIGRNRFEIEPSPFTPPASGATGLMAHYTFDDVADWPVPDVAGADNALNKSGTTPLVAPGIHPVPPNVFALPENGQVDLQWNERLGPNDENDAAQFKVYRSTTPDGSDRTEVATIDGSTTEFGDSGLDNGTLYYYEVTSIVDGAESDFSQIITARPYATLGGGGLTIEHGTYGTMTDRPSLDGYDQQLVNFGQTMTIETWIKHDGQSDEDAMIIDKRDADGVGYELSFVGSGQQVPVRFATGSFSPSITSASGVPADTWTHVAVVYDGNEIALYVNGELDVSQSASGGIDDGATPLQFGTNDAGNGQFFSGQLDEVRVWASSFTLLEVRELMYGDIASYSGLVAHYTFDGGTPLSDVAGGNDLSLTADASIVTPGIYPVPPHLYALPGNGQVALRWDERLGPQAQPHRPAHRRQQAGARPPLAATHGPRRQPAADVPRAARHHAHRRPRRLATGRQPPRG